MFAYLNYTNGIYMRITCNISSIPFNPVQIVWDKINKIRTELLKKYRKSEKLQLYCLSLPKNIWDSPKFALLGQHGHFAEHPLSIMVKKSAKLKYHHTKKKQKR